MPLTYQAPALFVSPSPQHHKNQLKGHLAKRTIHTRGSCDADRKNSWLARSTNRTTYTATKVLCYYGNSGRTCAVCPQRICFWARPRLPVTMRFLFFLSFIFFPIWSLNFEIFPIWSLNSAAAAIWNLNSAMAAIWHSNLSKGRVSH